MATFFAPSHKTTLLGVNPSEFWINLNRQKLVLELFTSEYFRLFHTTPVLCKESYKL